MLAGRPRPRRAALVDAAMIVTSIPGSGGRSCHGRTSVATQGTARAAWPAGVRPAPGCRGRCWAAAGLGAPPRQGIPRLSLRTTTQRLRNHDSPLSATVTVSDSKALGLSVPGLQDHR